MPPYFQCNQIIIFCGPIVITRIPVLCEGLPTEFQIYLNYCRGLIFEEEPDYTYLRQMFRLLYRSMNYQYDNEFDWTNSDDTLVVEMQNYSRSGRKKENLRALRELRRLMTESNTKQRMSRVSIVPSY